MGNCKSNVKEDFKKYHNLEVNELDGLAIMSDTDNSKMEAVAYYQNIYFQQSNQILRYFFTKRLNIDKITATITSANGLASG